MAKKSNYTKATSRKLWFFRILSSILILVPLIVYVIMALSMGQVLIVQKFGLISSVLVALLLTAFNFLAQKNLRAPVWIILLGLYFAIAEYLMPLIVLLAITSILDDLVFKPLIAHYKVKLVSSKTIDERM